MKNNHRGVLFFFLFTVPNCFLKKLVSVSLACTLICFSLPGTQSNLKILFVDGRFPSKSGAAVLNQMIGLIDRGCSVSIYASSRGDLERAHPNVHKYNLLNNTFFNKKKKEDKDSKNNFRLLYNLPKDLDTYDIIYCQYGYRGIDFAALAKEYKLKAKVITCFRGEDISSYLVLHPGAYKELFIQGDCFLPVCDYFKKILIGLGCDAHKIIVHHSAIDCNKFFYRKKLIRQEGPIKVVTVSRLVEKKGLEYSIKAVAQLLKKFPTLEYNIIGVGPLESELRNLINNLGVAHNIHLIGWASQDKIAEILDKSDIFVLASVTAHNGDQEGIPNAIKEAMAKGLPIISTYTAGIPELVQDWKSGFLVPERDADAIKRKIEYLIENPVVSMEFGKAGRDIVYREYDMEKVNDRLMIIFKKLLQN